ncbi:hypothetical protein [Paenibacillus sp. IHBB 10380]|uniref:hypothetical protein n=1 Tax=Paenibacillus sp. IHBB 10380 TaxID=1566358 RepID=UPI001364D1F3|nr:hypothetical protein [Paenibacillus sp. IHBB 10380]
MKNQYKIISIGSLALVIALSIALSNSKTEKVDDTVKYINSSAKGGDNPQQEP